MLDPTFSSSIRHIAKKRKLERESIRLAESQDRVRTRIMQEFGAPIEVFSASCQQPELTQNAGFQNMLSSLRVFLDKKIVF